MTNHPNLELLGLVAYEIDLPKLIENSPSLDVSNSINSAYFFKEEGASHEVRASIIIFLLMKATRCSFPQ